MPTPTTPHLRVVWLWKFTAGSQHIPTKHACRREAIRRMHRVVQRRRRRHDDVIITTGIVGNFVAVAARGLADPHVERRRRDSKWLASSLRKVRRRRRRLRWSSRRR